MKNLQYAGLFCIVAFIALAGLASMNPSTQSQAAPAQPHTQQRLASASTVLVGSQPTLSAAFIDRVLCQAASPACGTGNVLYDLGVKYGIDPAYALAFFQHESTFGKAGVARQTHSLGNIRCSAGWRCIAGFRAYANWEGGYEDWYRLIRWYASDLHKRQLKDIVHTYAPAADHNNPDGYVRSVCDAVNAWRSVQAQRGAAA